MNDLRLIFRYSKPYRRDLWAAAGLIFIECIFEMVIPVLMSTLVDEVVPSHNMAIILRQGGLMALCAVLALITGLLYARFTARFANGCGRTPPGRVSRRAEIRLCQPGQI